MMGFILVCALLQASCTFENALDVLRVPPISIATPFACLVESQQYAANVDYPLKKDQYFKIVCKHDHA